MINNKLLWKILFLFIGISNAFFAQQNNKYIEGKITFISGVTFYVKFPSTEGVSAGDTLFIVKGNNLKPALLVKAVSSLSASATKINGDELEVGDYVSALIVSEPDERKENDSEIVSDAIGVSAASEVQKSEPASGTGRIEKKRGKNLYGRVALSSYANISNTRATDYMRWRYTFSMNSDNFNSTDLSFYSYISFNYRSTDWNRIKNNLSGALKIYSLAVKYDFTENFSVTLGRKINSFVTNVSAIDGAQFDAKFGDFNVGAIVGSRPNFTDYGYNLKLFETGGYVSHSFNLGKGYAQSSVALFQQMNNGKTDRRFLYLQHSNNLVKNVNFFFSTEIDLFKKVNNKGKSDFSLTGLYFSLRYRPIRALSLFGSFDSRKNVVYYETFRNYVDSLYENATRQGFRFRATIRPIRKLSVGLTYGYRNRDGDLRASQNYNAYLSYSRIPFIDASASVYYNKLETSYLDGNIYGLRLSKDLLNGLIYSTLSVRRVDYDFTNNSPNLKQVIAGIELSARLMKKFILSINYEGTFTGNLTYGRFLMNITKRF
ncbi:MAG: hypothetical protein GXO87_10320 [Chlorobi bacterium]|nr:hypothetical protein [Chlorobiota bacterium]